MLVIKKSIKNMFQKNGFREGKNLVFHVGKLAE
jgi:hypothetical protein